MAMLGLSSKLAEAGMKRLDSNRIGSDDSARKSKMNLVLPWTNTVGGFDRIFFLDMWVDAAVRTTL